MRKILFLVSVVLVVISASRFIAASSHDHSSHAHEVTSQQAQNADAETALPLGDGQYSTTEPMQGGMFICMEPRGGAGAHTAGPWIDEAAGLWYPAEKISVIGEVEWPNAEFSVTVEEEIRRMIFSNGLPMNHTTGIFPIQANDPAYQYDRNPNTISPQTIEITLPTNPEITAEPTCLGFGAVAIMSNGVVVFHALDEVGRDAVAWETQDACNGHPQQSGLYHYHGHIDCVTDVEPDEGHSQLLGWAMDGFGLFGKYGEDGETLTNDDLDECHGHTHTIEWEGQTLEMYHYHMTDTFPYTIGCFRGTPVVSQAGPPSNGAPSSGGTGQQPQPPAPPSGGSQPPAPPPGGGGSQPPAPPPTRRP